MNYRQSLSRIPGHFLIWAAVPLALGYGAFYFGLPDFTVRERLLVFAVSTMGFFHSEVRQWETRRQTAGKTWIDFFAKVAGVGLGLALVNFWWKGSQNHNKKENRKWVM